MASFEPCSCTVAQIEPFILAPFEPLIMAPLVRYGWHCLNRGIQHRIIDTKILKKNDLIIRDLGYFSLAAFHKMLDSGIYFLSRLQFNIAIYDI